MDIKKICLAVVTNRQIKPKTVLSIANLIAHTKHEIFTVIATEGYTTAEGRTYCIIQATKANCSHILFIDDDMIFPEDTIEILLADQKEIIGVDSNSRTLPLSSTVALLDEKGEYINRDRLPPWHELPEETFECFSVGMGVALIDMKVFDVIEKPWFKFESLDVGKITIGEDAWFCRQARNKGLKVWCNPTLEIKHIGDYLY